MRASNNECPEKTGIAYKQRLNDIAKELFRKSIHLCSALIPLLLKHCYWVVIISLTVVVILYSLSELARLHNKTVPLISAITAAAARKRDENKFVLGPVTLVLGILLCALIWKPIPASIGIYALAFGDGLASLAGKLFGKIHIPFTEGKTVAGSLTCFIAIFISSFSVSKSASTSLVIASCGMFIEVMPLKDFDNILIPILLGGIAQTIM
ncbi:MAG: phosphatidate cytidylyltransferase [Treponema sp.]